MWSNNNIYEQTYGIVERGNKNPNKDQETSMETISQNESK